LIDFYYGGGGGSSSSGGFRDQSRPGAFEEYNAGDDEEPSPVRRSGSVSQRAGSSASGTSSSRRGTTTAPVAPAPEPPKAKEPEVDLLGGLDDDAFSTAAPAVGGGAEKALPVVSTSFGGLDGELTSSSHS
jgi:epsin